MNISRFSSAPVLVPYEAADFPPNSISGGSNGFHFLSVT